ncbi:unnamed protein product [Ectocarpus sp. 12 AP-2014]
MTILHVGVTEKTPRSLWSPRGVEARPIKRSSKTRFSSRVPVVRALHLTWALSMEICCGRRTPSCGCHQKLLSCRDRGMGLAQDRCLGPGACNVWLLEISSIGLLQKSRGSVSLQQLSFGYDFNQPITGVVWASALQQLSFGSTFDQPITGVAWPVSLQERSFESFNQPITSVAWPASLQQLSFGYDFNQPVAGVVWQVSLQQLSFENDFNQPIICVVWPSALQRLSFGST